MTKLELLDSWYRDVWQNGDLDAIDGYFLPGAAAQGVVPGLAVTPEECREFVSVIQQMISDLKYRFLQTVEEGEWLSTLVEMKSIANHNDKPIHLISQVMVRVENGLFAEIYNASDFLGFFEQMGQLPEDALPLLLSGTFMR